ncbi:hypothetical protein COV19_00355 [Candidatus Woesearchaeota archaeon CG10_big_fil_rev_8_21_14_0_10_44_13]|nr:MAG: hypothetical protein COV19_00355 [Candidatus Woesearchaeota archaeon CG10_big_fil_rev_8_21_14_0_10_44_13]
MASDGDPIIYAGAGFFGGLYLFYKGFTWLKLKKLIENMPTSKVRAIAMGLVEVYGEVVPYEKKLLKSPLLDKDCVYYSYSIQEERGSGKHRHWVTLKSGREMVHFYLKDNTGEVLVDPEGATVDMKADLNVTSSLGKDPPAAVMQALKRMKLSHDGFLGMNKTMRYTEYLVEPKDKLYILGVAGDNPFVEDTKGQKNEEDIMIQKGKHGDIYYLSDRNEKELLKSLKWKSIGGVIGGAVLSLFCLTLIIAYFGLW